MPTQSFASSGLGARFADSNWARRLRAMGARTQRIVGLGGAGLFVLGIIFMATTQTPYCELYLDGSTACGGSVLHTIGESILFIGIALLVLVLASIVLHYVERMRKTAA